MVNLKSLLAKCLTVALCHSHCATALPLDDQSLGRNGSHPFAGYPQLNIVKSRQNGPTELRILSLGASIMSGQGSLDDARPSGAGLRKWLRMALVEDDWPVNMVGYKHTGVDMVDNDHEATPGAVWSEIRRDLQRSLGYRPNIVIINGGTNNANRGIEVNRAYQAMEEIANDIWGTDGMADTCIILSTLLPGGVQSGLQNRVVINAAFRRLVRDLRDTRCIYLADMEPSGVGANFLAFGPQLYVDDTHPNDEGHRRMAYVFYAAIQRALAANKVKGPVPKLSEPSTGCDKEFGGGVPAGGLTQTGSGVEDGIYYHRSQEMPIAVNMTSQYDRDQWRFARLYSSKYDDLVGWFEFSPGVHRFGVWKNSANGQGAFNKIGDLFPNILCSPEGLHFIDMNADGLDDIVCIDAAGNAYLSINSGDGNAQTPPRFTLVNPAQNGLIFTSQGPRDSVVLGDIDGDGRGDIGILAANGNVQFYRNGGQDDVPQFWQPLGLRVDFGASGAAGNIGPISGFKAVRFEDINGDASGRDDYMYMRDTGETFTWTNARSCLAGTEGDGLNVAWRQGFNIGSTSGPTMVGMANYIDPSDPDPTLQRRIHFARIYGTEPAFGNLGVQDYVFIEHRRISDTEHRFFVRPWRNLGSGGTKLLADGNKYCNMMGHEDGSMDYVWTMSTGAMRLYPNAGKKTLVGDPSSFWGDVVNPMWTPPGNANMDRRDLHLADWDGDGDCDIIHVNRATGNVRVWRNNYPTLRQWSGAFTEIQNVPTLTCAQKRGIGIDDLAVRFADITGNKRADYLCIEKDGRVSGSVQGDNGQFEPINQIKFSEDKDRANLRWADVNGDGRDDMIWVDKFNGDGHVWYNRGRVDPAEFSGSSFRWEGKGAAYEGSYAGTCQFFPDLDGNGRADLHSIRGTFTNEAETWFNPSCGLDDNSGNDPDQGQFAGLPEQPGNPSDGSPGPGEEPINDSEVCENADNRPWRNVRCTHPVIDDESRYTAKEQWDGTEASSAWLSVVNYWDCYQQLTNAGDSFSNAVADWLDVPPMLCGSLSAVNGCGGSNFFCDDTEGRGPAGRLILDSFRTLSDFQRDLYQTISTATSTITFGTMAGQFGISGGSGNVVAVNIVTDILTMAFAIIAAPTWNKFLAPRISDPSNLNTIKDGINDIVYTGATTAKDIYSALHPSDNLLDLQNQLATFISRITTSWRQGIEEANQRLFDGSPGSMFRLGSAIQDGVFLDQWTLGDRSLFPLEDDIRQVLHAALIPVIWRASPMGLWPVIIHENIGCNTRPNNPDDWLSGDAYSKRVCGDFTDNESYWLIAPRNAADWCMPLPGGIMCSPWNVPPGFAQLEQSSYGVSVRDVVGGSINTWKRNGRTNGAPIPALDTAFFDTVARDRLTSPGMFNIPICGIAEVKVNMERALMEQVEPWVNFPCNA